MGNPLKDQLLKAGLVNKKQAKRAEHEQRVSRQKQQPKGKDDPGNLARQQQEEQARRARELNRQRDEERMRQELTIQVKQLVETNRMTLDNQGGVYNFVDNNKIKRLYLSDEMADQLSVGRLAIVRDGVGYAVVSAKVAEQIAERVRESVVAFHGRG